MSAPSRRRRFLGPVLLAALFPAVALLSPLLASSRPLVSRDDGRALLQAPVPWDPEEVRLDARLSPPSASHWLGTDDLGRDVLSRVLHGTRVSVGVGLLSASLALLAGALLGGAAGLLGGRTDRLLLGVVEVFQTLPPLVLAASAAAFLRPSALSAALLIAAVSWTDAARLVRAQAQRAAASPFVEAARAAGASRLRLLLRHVLPHALPPALSTAPYVLGAAVVAEASLSFLGLGAPPPTASWGRALADARGVLGEAWWCAAGPGLALVLLVLSARRLGDALESPAAR